MLRKFTALLLAAIFIVAVSLGYASAREDQDLAGKVIILDAGHGKGSSPVYAGYVEHAVMLRLALKIKPLLEARGADVRLTRQDDDTVPLEVRTAMVNKWALEAVRDARERELESAETEEDTARLLDDLTELDRLLDIIQSVIDDPKTNAPVYINIPFDYSYKREIHPDWQKVFEYQNDPEVRERFLFISLHSNATPNPINTSANGAIVFYISNDIKNNARYYSNYSYSGESLSFAEAILDGINALGIRNRGAAEYYFLMIREHNIPGVLVENGFHTNRNDRTKLLSNSFLNKLASAYCTAISGYFSALSV